MIGKFEIEIKVCELNDDYLDGLLNFFKTIEDYIFLVMKLHQILTDFFWL